MSGRLPQGDANGLAPVIRQMIERPGNYHVVIGIVDTKRIVTDLDTGDVTPQARLRRIEVVLDQQDLQVAEKLLRRAVERRSGQTVLPLDLEDEIKIAFRDLDPSTGEMPNDGT